jgi:hypothetical protein
MPFGLVYGNAVPAVKVLYGIPRHETYRSKLRAKWRRKGYEVRFA